VFAATTTLTGELANAGTATEAFAWNMTALAGGVALGSALAGVLIDASGAGLAFVAAGTAGLGAAAITAARARTLVPCASGPTATSSSRSAASAATP
jgi:predicted MFS family arabinose efflux permease